MIKIRPGCFETNSSSMDRYEDYDDDTPRYGHARQLVHIKLKWQEGTSDTRIDEICDEIYNNKIDDKLFDIFESYYNDSNSEMNDADYDEITFYENCSATISWHGKYYPATRYEPAEYPEPEIDDIDGVPLKNHDYPSKNKDKDAVMKIFKEMGWTEIVEIIDIYSDDIDEQEVFNNLC